MYSAFTDGTSSKASIQQKLTRWLRLMSGRCAADLMRARRASNPPASAEACKVYWAVVARDSRMRRAIFSRTVLARGGAGAVAGVGAVAAGGSGRACEA